MNHGGEGTKTTTTAVVAAIFGYRWTTTVTAVVVVVVCLSYYYYQRQKRQNDEMVNTNEEIRSKRLEALLRRNNPPARSDDNKNNTTTTTKRRAKNDDDSISHYQEEGQQQPRSNKKKKKKPAPTADNDGSEEEKKKKIKSAYSAAHAQNDDDDGPLSNSNDKKLLFSPPTQQTKTMTTANNVDEPVAVGAATAGSTPPSSSSSSPHNNNNSKQQQTTMTTATNKGEKRKKKLIRGQPNTSVVAAKKTKKKKPPRQLLEEALARASAGSSSGLFGASSSKASVESIIVASMIMIPTTTTNKDKDDESMDWEELKTNIAVHFGRSNNKTVVSSSFRELAVFYGNLQSERSSCVSSKQTDLASCLQMVGTAVQERASALLDAQQQVDATSATAVINTKAPWVLGQRPATDENDEGMDLFTAYDVADNSSNHDGRSNNKKNSRLNGTAAGDLVELLEQNHSSMTPSFLEWKKDTTARFVLNVVLGRIAEAFDGSQQIDVLSRLTVLSTLVSKSVSVRKALGRAFLDSSRSLQQGESNSSSTGRELEASDVLQPLLSLVGYSLPWPENDDGDDINNVWNAQLQVDIPNYPVGALLRTSNTAVGNCMEFGRRVQSSAQSIAVSIFRLAMKLSPEHKRAVFDWARRVAVTNEALADMLRGELLSPEGLTALSSSWPFLIGTCRTVVALSTSSLAQRFEKSASKAFNGLYLLKCSADSSWNPLIPRRAKPRQPAADDSSSFDGATEFFFLSCMLLRSALYPLLRVEDEFHHQNRRVIVSLQDLARREETTLPAYLQKVYMKATSTWLGFDTLLKCREFCDVVTQFTTLQLKWVHSVVQDKEIFVPDWFAKEPPRWLMHVARHQQQHLKPWQAEQVVMVTTQLLTIGSQEGQSFSPLVLTELIRVAAAFVAAGVSRARRKENNRHGQRRWGKNPVQYDDDDDDDYIIDDRALDSYLSFDATDLGVAVFSNELVCRDLCPTLLRTFRALDIVEGLDVDREASFDKFGVKVEIADLLLRLWGHPNGKCRDSVLRQPPRELASFASSVAAAIGYLLDDACQRMADVTKGAKRGRVGGLLPIMNRDQAFIEGQTRSAVSGFLCGRRLLLLLCRFSMEPKFAAAIGDDSACASEMAAMAVHFLDILTSSDGGTNAELDWKSGSESSSALAAREPSMSVQERQSMASSLVAARTKCRREFGLDVSVLSHQLLSLAARWCYPKFSNKTMPSPSQKWLEALAANEDCDPDRYQAILERLICIPTGQQGLADGARLVFKHDGYVDASIWVNERTPSENLSENQKQLRRSAAQEQMSHSDIDMVANRETITQFVRVLSEQQRPKTASTIIRAEDVKRFQDEIMTEESGLVENEYGESFSEWVVSSESFAAPDGGSLLHFFDKTARNSHGSIGSGKVLTKEARKCLKGIPVPHANSAVFVCFAEERLDLCRAAVTGPVDTPYAHGIFIMDVHFPPTYPNIPPLVQWMTTGGGQVRFGPNLYQDGKVCLSLLGTFHATDESQKWNPRISSLAQILLSIQTQLLTSEPYFNEPGHEAMINTQAGKDGSRRYNSKRRLDTLRHAIIAQMRHPPQGFEEISQRHFAMCRQRIVAQARRWTLEARGSPLEGRFVKAYGQLLSLLSEQDFQGRACLPPNKEDMSYLAQHDPSFSCAGFEEDCKPAAVASQATSAPNIGRDEAAAFLTALAAAPSANINPWSAHQHAASNPWATPPVAGSKKDTEDDDDDEDFYD